MADLARLRTVFMGTPLFAVPCLKKLHAVSDVAAVVTQPDRPRGRGQRMTPSPVKAYAIEQGLPVFQPVKVRETAFLETLRKIQPDLIVVVAFGQILPSAILALPKQGCINVHASLLPRYRGAAPMQRCLMAGEKTTGVTTMFMDAGLDTGDMLQKTEIPIGPDMTLAELHDAGGGSSGNDFGSADGGDFAARNAGRRHGELCPDDHERDGTHRLDKVSG